MSGREKIEQFNWLIKLMITINKCIPKFILNIMWTFCESSENKMSLLFRYLYVNKYSQKCGENIFIGKYVTIKNIQSLTLGNNISIHAYCYIDAYGTIEIDDNVSIANHTTLVSFEHTWNDPEKPIKYNHVDSKKINILSDVWIGSGCRVLSGVTISSRSIVAAGAVVNKNIPSSVIVGGIPFKVIKEI